MSGSSTALTARYILIRVITQVILHSIHCVGVSHDGCMLGPCTHYFQILAPCIPWKCLLYVLVHGCVLAHTTFAAHAGYNTSRWYVQMLSGRHTTLGTQIRKSCCCKLVTCKTTVHMPLHANHMDISHMDGPFNSLPASLRTSS